MYENVPESDIQCIVGYTYYFDSQIYSFQLFKKVDRSLIEKNKHDFKYLDVFRYTYHIF